MLLDSPFLFDAPLQGTPRINAQTLYRQKLESLGNIFVASLFVFAQKSSQIMTEGVSYPGAEIEFNV